MLLPLLVGVVTAVPFLRSLGQGFVLWDDDVMFLDNPHYRGLGPAHLAWMWTAHHMGHYMPVTWMSHGVDYTLWGMNAGGYHATTVLLHALNAVLVYVLALRLLGGGREPAGEAPVARRVGAAAAALLWGLHPLRVESVVWATERRDVLSTLFYLLAVLAYLRAHQGALRAHQGALRAHQGALRARLHATALGFFALALLSKSMAVTLPLVLVVLDVYPLRRLGGGVGWLGPGARVVWREKLPFVLLALAASVVAVGAALDFGAVRTFAQVSPVARIGVAVHALAFYLAKLVAPVGLAPLYELPERVEVFTRPYLGAAAAVLLVTVASATLRRRWPALLAVWIVFVVVLLPVLGFAQNGVQRAADRYTYLACIGVTVLAGAGIERVWQAIGRGPRPHRRHAVAAAGAIAIVATLGVLTWRQVGVWQDSETLWTRVLAHGPSALAHTNLGVLEARRGRTAEAIAHFRAAMALRPTLVAAHYNWGVLLADEGRLDEAIAWFQRALAINPAFPDAENDWGLALLRQQRLDEAISHFQRAVALDGELATPHSNWGLALAYQGRFAEAEDHLRRALALRPDHAEAHFNFGYALLRQGREDDAEREFRRAIALDPALGAARAKLAPPRAR